MSKRRFRKQKLPSEPVELEITSLSHEGRGIAHIDGKVAFVDGALAGETVTASYIRRRNSYDELRTEVVQKASPLRVTPPCAFAGTCGGCSLQHMEPAAQIEFKQSVLLEQMTQAHIDYMLGKIPMGRFLEVTEAAAMVAWLSSEDCSFSTGAVFDLTGGRATY